MGLAVFHGLFELRAVITLDPDIQPEIQWPASSPPEAVRFLADLAVSSGKIATANAAQEDLTAAGLQQAAAIIPDTFLPVPAGFLQPTAALLHEFAAQILVPRELNHLVGQPQLRLYPAMNTIEANQWWPELLERVSQSARLHMHHCQDGAPCQSWQNSIRHISHMRLYVLSLLPDGYPQLTKQTLKSRM